MTKAVMVRCYLLCLLTLALCCDCGLVWADSPKASDALIKTSTVGIPSLVRRAIPASGDVRKDDEKEDKKKENNRVSLDLAPDVLCFNGSTPLDGITCSPPPPHPYPPPPSPVPSTGPGDHKTSIDGEATGNHAQTIARDSGRITQDRTTPHGAQGHADDGGEHLDGLSIGPAAPPTTSSTPAGGISTASAGEAAQTSPSPGNSATESNSGSNSATTEKGSTSERSESPINQEGNVGNTETTTTTTTLPPEPANNKKGDADSSSIISSSVWMRVPLLIVVTLACILVC
ncbi:uncharacterized protein TM35_000961080 [Trypanosoma theileri]|uniref:Mucin TcMUCII n=1 Tax=Trypanosoma theileri TaxID=67003 RepID=A0A1X0NEG0_9TRYP|nr:uncharacterized protein TM35_000961080 [Trypanosoma theileri]ORC82229.1 hypothetical protein TM35_000961080 [Trypanosoma theileri]